MSHPQVVNVRCAPRDTYIYVGRRCARFNESPFGNPFSHHSNAHGIRKVPTRDDAVYFYREWLEGNMIFAGLEQRRDEILRRIPALADAIKDGRKLGCWCAPQACHGEVLVELCERHLGRKIGSNNRKEHG